MVWRTVKTCPAYEVSIDGEVRRAGRKCKPWATPPGYVYVDLWTNNRRQRHLVSRLVLQTFVGDPPTNQHDAHHRDNDRSNNQLNNLEWVTKKQNCFHKRAHGTYLTGERLPWTKLTETEVHAIRAAYVKRQNGGIDLLAMLYGVGRSTIHLIVTRKNWRHVQ